MDIYGCNNYGYAAWLSGTVLDNKDVIKNAIRNFYIHNHYNSYPNTMVGYKSDLIPGAKPGRHNDKDQIIEENSLENLTLPIQYSINNIEGKFLGTGVIQSDSKINVETLKTNLKDQPKGIYIIRLVDVKGTIKDIKLNNI